MRMARIRLGGGIVARVGMLDIEARGIYFGRAVVQQQRFAVPVKPQVLVFPCLVNPVIQLLHHHNRRAVERPETELRHAIAFGLHLLHDPEHDIPFIPIPNRVGDVHHQNVHPRIGKHGHVFTDHVDILAEKIALFRLAPVMHAIGPQRVTSIQARQRIGGKHLGHVRRVWAFRRGQRIAVPRNIENAHHPALVLLDRANRPEIRHGSTKRIGRRPRVRIQIAIG